MSRAGAAFRWLVRRAPAALLVLCVPALGAGCEEETTAGRANTRGPARAAPTPSSERATPAPIGGFAQRERPRAFPTSSRRAPRAPEGSNGRAAADEEARETRNDADTGLQRALTHAFGDPSSCLSDAARDQMGERLQLQVTVRVTGTGRCIDAQVSGGGLPAADLACLTRRAETLRLPGPIEDAPRTVSASIEYAVEDTRTQRAERTPEDPERHRGTVRADRTLDPAGTETARPGGFVEPSRTLPANAEPAQPPGYVPPASTLPAVGN
ncbi:MAG: hypothetical protein AB8I08_17470 [Sandaracinaceae bacterium]